MQNGYLSFFYEMIFNTPLNPFQVPSGLDQSCRARLSWWVGRVFWMMAFHPGSFIERVRQSPPFWPWDRRELIWPNRWCTVRGYAMCRWWHCLDGSASDQVEQSKVSTLESLPRCHENTPHMPTTSPSHVFGWAQKSIWNRAWHQKLLFITSCINVSPMKSWILLPGHSEADDHAKSLCNLQPQLLALKIL